MPNMRVGGEALPADHGVFEIERPPWVSAARFDQLKRDALDQAEREHMLQAQQRLRGRRMAGVIAVVVGFGGFITALWYKEGDLVICMTVLLVLAGILGIRTRKPVSVEVNQTAGMLLNLALNRFHREQLASSDFFHCEAWQALRRSALERGEARCVRCGRKASAMLVVEHICPPPEAPDRALDPANVQILCHACKNEEALRTGTA